MYPEPSPLPSGPAAMNGRHNAMKALQHGLTAFALCAGLVGLVACGTSGSGGDAGQGTASMPSTAVAPPPATSIVLAPPQLRFSDTGFSVSDAITRDGRWSVVSEGVGWEVSLDLGKNWVKGSGEGFEVKGDGPRTIWVRARDDRGNTSEVVVVGCVLDTTAPMAPVLAAAARGPLQELRLDALEPQALWEYSLDGQKTWFQAEGRGLLVYGNGVPAIALRQVDLAGNPSVAVTSTLPPANAGIDVASLEASSLPLVPTVLGEPAQVGATSPTGTSGAIGSGSTMTSPAAPMSTRDLASGRSLLVHGEVVRGDADFMRIDVPAGYRLHALRLVHYASEDAIAFFALQRAAVFDAGVDTQRMAAWGHFGPQDLARNLLERLGEPLLAAGPLVLWVQQTGDRVTRYAFQIDLRTSP